MYETQQNAYTGEQPGDYEPRPLSPSSMATYEDCPKKWKYRYIDKLPDPPGTSAVVGTFAHNILEQLMQLPAEERSQDFARSAATQEFSSFQHQKDFVALELSHEEVREFKKQAWNAICGLWEVEDPQAVQVASTEQHLNIKVRGVPFRGYVDRVDKSQDGLVVNDYKSGKPPAAAFIDPSRRHLEDKHLFQVMLYSAAIAEDTSALPAKARVLYIGDTRQVSEDSVTAEKISDVGDKLTKVWGAVTKDLRTKQFEPLTGPLCAYCPYLEICKEGQAKVKDLYNEGKLKANALAWQVMDFD